MLRTLAHACYIVRDLEATEKFYCDGLGMTNAFDFLNDDGSRRGFYLSVGDRTFLEFFKGDPKPVTGGSYRHISLEVDDLDAMLARLSGAGIETTEKKLGKDQSWQAWITDPDGNPIELHCYTANSEQTKALARLASGA